MTTITLPLSEKQAVAIVVAADRFSVEPWEMAVHILQARRWPTGTKRRRRRVSHNGSSGAGDA